MLSQGILHEITDNLAFIIYYIAVGLVIASFVSTVFAVLLLRR